MQTEVLMQFTHQVLHHIQTLILLYEIIIFMTFGANHFLLMEYILEEGIQYGQLMGIVFMKQQIFQLLQLQDIVRYMLEQELSIKS